MIVDKFFYRKAAQNMLLSAFFMMYMAVLLLGVRNLTFRM